MTEPTPLFTVFTPTYNRRHTLPRVIDSLAAQSCGDFEWLVVDDGSTDGTEAWLRDAASVLPFPVRILRQENAGKAAAITTGLELARGALFLILDSDDACMPETLERLAAVWRGIPEAVRDGYAGVACLCRTPDGAVVGTPYPASPLDAAVPELEYAHHVRGEKWWVVRTDVMREFPFPRIPGVRFLPEGLVWHRMGRRYRLRCVNEALRIYFDEPDGLTVSVRRVRPDMLAGLLLYHRMVLEEEARWIRQAPAAILRSAANLTRYALHAGRLPAVSGGVAWLLALAGLPLGLALYGRDRLRR